MTNWVLIIAFFSPGGDFMSKQEIVQKDQKTCQQSMATVAKETPLARVKTLCVERDAKGINLTRNVALD
jgi:propanediol utilization protein